MLFRSFVHLFCFGERFSRDRASRNQSREQKIRYITSRDQPGKVWISYNFYMKCKWTVFQASAKQTVKIYSFMQPTFLLSKGVKYDAKLIFIDRLISRKHMSLIATQQQRWHRVPHLHIRSCPSMQMRQFDLLNCRKKRQYARVTSLTVRLLTSLKARRRFVSQFNGDGEPVGRTGTVKLRHKSTPRL